MIEKSSVGFGHYLVVIRRHWKVIVSCAVVGCLGALAYLALAPAKLTASALVNVNAIVSDPFSSSRSASGLLDPATEDQIVSSYVVARAAEASIPGGDDATALRDGVTVTSGTNATTLRISYTSTTADRARAGADAIAKAYLSYRQSEADARKVTMVKQLQDQAAQMTASLAKAALADRSAISARIANVQYQINQYAAVDTTGGALITPAAQSPVSSAAPWAVVAAAGVLGGLVLGLALAFLSNAAGRRVRDAYDIEQSAGVPVLAEPGSAEATIPARAEDLNDFRAVREQLLSAAKLPLEVVTVLDATSSETPSDVAANLGVVFAQTGTAVELIVMGAPEDHVAALRDGLSLRQAGPDATGTAEVFRSARIPGMSVLLCPRSDPDLGDDQYVSSAVKRRVAERSDRTLVVLALPPDAPRASYLAAGRLSDASLIVAERFRTRSTELTRSCSELQGIGVRIMGVVLVRKGRHLARTMRSNSPRAQKTLERESVTT